MGRCLLAGMLLGGLAGSATAQPEAPQVPEAEPAVEEHDEGPPLAPVIDIHGFVSQGGFFSTANDYIGESSRGSVELFETGINQPPRRQRSSRPRCSVDG